MTAILYVKLGLRFIKKEAELKTYDAFILYSPEDIQFVKHDLLDPLENMDPPFHTCIPERDFDVGGFKHPPIIRSIQESNLTIGVLSQHFINNHMCQFAFAQAHMHQLETLSYKVLLIALEDPKTLENAPELINSYIKARTYLAQDDNFFWQKLLYQMPKK